MVGIIIKIDHNCVNIDFTIFECKFPQVAHAAAKCARAVDCVTKASMVCFHIRSNASGM